MLSALGYSYQFFLNVTRKEKPFRDAKDLEV